ncbi:MAG TPA: glycosyl transferase, partial [Kribbellaceae bacterium]
RPAWRLVLSGAVLLTAGWSYVLLNRTADWHPWLRYAVVAAGVIAAAALLLTPAVADGAPVRRRAMARRVGVVAALSMAFAALAGPAAYSAQTIDTSHAGALPSAGPAAMAGVGGRGGPMGAPGGARFGPPPGQAGTGQAMPGQGTIRQGMPGQGGAATGGTAGRAGGFLGGAGINQVPADLVTLLRNGATGYSWSAAAVTAMGAAPLQIASGVPVMAIGGFNGTDPTPTLAEFQKLVAQGKVHYFVATGGAPGGAGRGTSSEISSWVAANYTAQTVGGYTVYDLTTGA